MALVLVLRRRNSRLGPGCYNRTNKSFTETLIVSFAAPLRPWNPTKNLVTFNSWGRGNPEQYTEAMNLGGDDSNYDPMDDKKPRAGQILWTRTTSNSGKWRNECWNRTLFFFQTHNFWFLHEFYFLWFLKFFEKFWKLFSSPARPPFLLLLLMRIQANHF